MESMKRRFASWTASLGRLSKRSLTAYSARRLASGASDIGVSLSQTRAAEVVGARFLTCPKRQDPEAVVLETAPISRKARGHVRKRAPTTRHRQGCYRNRRRR